MYSDERMDLTRQYSVEQLHVLCTNEEHEDMPVHLEACSEVD
jgi:hypothetical protein